MSGSDDIPHFHGHRDRLRARFSEVGGDAVPDYELLELVLFRSIPRRDVKPLAKELVAFRLLRRSARRTPVPAPGGGRSGRERHSRSQDRRGLGPPPCQGGCGCLFLSSWSSVLDYCRTAMAFMDKEQFRLLFLDKRNALIADEVQQSGTVDHTPVYPREIVKRALELSASALILVQNLRLSKRRPDPLLRRHQDHPRYHRHRGPARHRGARSHHRRSRGTCEPEGAEADLGRSLGPRLRRMISADVARATADTVSSAPMRPPPPPSCTPRRLPPAETKPPGRGACRHRRDAHRRRDEEDHRRQRHHGAHEHEEKTEMECRSDGRQDHVAQGARKRRAMHDADCWERRRHLTQSRHGGEKTFVQ